MALRSGWEKISQPVLGTVDSHWLETNKMASYWSKLLPSQQWPWGQDGRGFRNQSWYGGFSLVRTNKMASYCRISFSAMDLRSGWERISQPVLGTVDSHWLETNKMPPICRISFSAMDLRSGWERISQPVLGTVDSHWFEQIKWPPIGQNSYLLSNSLEVGTGEDFATSLGTVSSYWFEQIKWPLIGRDSYLLSNGLEVRSLDGGFSLVRTNKMASYWSKTPTLSAIALRSGWERISQPVMGTVDSYWF